MHTTPKILIVDDQDSLRDLLTKFIRRSGYEPIEAKDGEKAVELYHLMQPAVILTDVQMPKMSGIELLKKIKEIDRDAIVILMTGFGSEETLMDALRNGANNYFKKPFKFQEIIDCIDSTLRHKEDIDVTGFYSPFLREETKEFVFRTRDADIHPIINHITIPLRHFFAASDIVNVKTGMEEILTNAIEHGNLGITFEEKNECLENGSFGALLEKRCVSGGRGDKLVVVRSRIDPYLFRVEIEDEGEGFDWRAIPDPNANNLLTFNGRGIFLTRFFFDNLSYEKDGRRAILLKTITAKH